MSLEVSGTGLAPLHGVTLQVHVRPRGQILHQLCHVGLEHLAHILRVLAYAGPSVSVVWICLQAQP